MDKKIMTLLIILIFSAGCLSFVSADNNTTSNLTVENIEDNLTDYIIPVYITEKGIEFSDGFIGFSLDSSKDVISIDDQFTSQNTRNDEMENNVKLAIIECYKAGKENDIQNIVSQVINGNKNYDIVESVFNSTESVDDSAVVNINNTTEATFTFELLKPLDDGKSDCLAYKVSFETIASADALGASNENTNDTVENTTETNNTTNTTENNSENTTQNNNTVNTTENNNTANTTENNLTQENKNVNDAKQVTVNQTIINKTNNTIINNNTLINETNNTVINQNNTKIINKTNETPKNATIQETIMRVVGNPITLLAIVIAIIAIVGIVMRRKQ